MTQEPWNLLWTVQQKAKQYGVGRLSNLPTPFQHRIETMPEKYQSDDHYQAALSYFTAVITKNDTLADEIENTLDMNELATGLLMVNISLMSKVLKENPNLSFEEAIKKLRTHSL